MQELNKFELEEVSGGFSPLVVLAVAMIVASVFGGQAHGGNGGSGVSVSVDL